MRDKFITQMQVSVVIDDKRGWGRRKKAQNFHKHPQEPQDFQKKKKKVCMRYSYKLFNIFYDNNFQR